MPRHTEPAHRSRRRALYFAYFGAISTLPFLPLLLARAVAPAAVAQLYALSTLASLATTPAVAFLADKHDAHRLAIVATFAFGTAALALFLVESSFASLLGVMTAVTCLRAPATPLLDALTLREIAPEEYGAVRLWGTVAAACTVFSVGWLIENVFDNDLDSMVWMSFVSGAVFLVALVLLGSSQREYSRGDEDEEVSTEGDDYERERIAFARSGFMPARTLSYDFGASFRARRASSSAVTVEMHDHRRAFTDASSIRQVTEVSDVAEEAADESAHFPAWLLRPRTLVFLMLALSLGMTISVIDKYLVIYLAEYQQLGLQALGTIMPARVCFEIPAFKFSSEISRRFGVKRQIAFAIAVLVLRLVLYQTYNREEFTALAQRSKTSVVVAIELLHGIYFALFWSAGLAFVDADAPPRLKATAQGVFAACYYGVGDSIGAWAGGALYERSGHAYVRGLALFAAAEALPMGVFAGVF